MKPILFYLYYSRSYKTEVFLIATIFDSMLGSTKGRASNLLTSWSCGLPIYRGSDSKAGVGTKWYLFSKRLTQRVLPKAEKVMDCFPLKKD